MKYLNGKLVIKQDSNIPLPCYADVEIKNGIITGLSLKGHPRTEVDAWACYWNGDTKMSAGDEIKDDFVEYILLLNGSYNLKSYFIITQVKDGYWSPYSDKVK